MSVLLLGRSANEVGRDISRLEGTLAGRPMRIAVFGKAGDIGSYQGLRVLSSQSFLPLVGHPEGWRDVDQLVVGQSLSTTIPRYLLRAFVTLAELAAGRSLEAEGDQGSEGGIKEWLSPTLATWLMDVARKLEEGGKGVTLGELEYFLLSGCIRAKALLKVIDRVAPGCKLYKWADIGTGIGFIPLVVAASEGLEVREVSLVEPVEKFALCGQDLWRSVSKHGVNFEFRTCNAEEVALEREQDLIFLGQCFFRISPQRRKDVIKKLSGTLSPIGKVVLNEIVRSVEGSSDPEWDERYAKCLRVDELVEAFGDFGPMRVLRRKSDWQKLEVVDGLRGVDMSSDSFFVAPVEGGPVVSKQPSPNGYKS